MTIYSGDPLTLDDVSLRTILPETVVGESKSPDFEREINEWASTAGARDDVLYFAIFHEGALVGHIFLHDMDNETKTSLVGYHIFRREQRRQGIGAQALRLLQQYVIRQTDLRRLIAITTTDNAPSRAIGRKNGFTETGPSREDPDHGVVMEWLIPKR